MVLGQDWQEPLQWIVVDDVEPRTALICPGDDATLRPAATCITTLHPLPSWKPGQNTLARNLLAAIERVAYQRVLFIEDDDFYPSDYVSSMCALLNEHDMAGCSRTHYYHFRTKRYRVMNHPGRSSLCHTGMVRAHLPTLAEICRSNSPYIDVSLWDETREFSRKLLDVPLMVGMKGLPGRPGIGIGHRPEASDRSWIPDPDMQQLREWIGKAVELYGGKAAARSAVESQSGR
jgi:hypothetical protein